MASWPLSPITRCSPAQSPPPVPAAAAGIARSHRSIPANPLHELQKTFLLPGEGAENMRPLDPPTVQGFSSSLVPPDQLTNPCTKRSQRPIGDKKGFAARWWSQRCLEQDHQRGIHAGHAHENRASASFLQHLQGDAAGGFGDPQSFWRGLVHPSRSSTNSEQVSPLVISRWSRARVQAT